MVLKVGDKVVVYNAGTDNAMAVKWEACKVGDKVNVITLSDGTKIAMPRLELDTRDYVWKYPEIPVDFNFDTDFTYGIMPLGAAIFKITGVPDCYNLEDDKREWESEEIVGMKLMVFRVTNGRMETVVFTITGWEYPNYTVVLDPVDTSYLLWTVRNELDFMGRVQFIPPTSISDRLLDLSKSWTGARSNIPYPEIYSPRYILAGIKEIRFQFLYKSKYGGALSDWSSPKNQIIVVRIDNTEIYQWNSYCATVKKIIEGVEYRCNPDYPKYTTIVIPESKWAGLLNAVIRIFLYGSSVSSGSYFYSPDIAVVTGITLIPSACQTEDVVVNDKYVIYNPVTKKMVFNDAAKLLTAIDWRTSTGVGDAFMTDLIEYAWDGLGHVYLSQSKTTLSTIFYEDSLRVQAAHGSTLKEIPFHTNDLYIYSGETVSRELVDITSILVAGANDISLAVKNTLGGAKIGFATPVYIMRSMD